MSRSIKYIKTVFLLTVFTMLFNITLYSQDSNWFALSNGIGLMANIDVDSKGNVYSLGQGAQETQFLSVDTNEKQQTSYFPWNSDFVTKYSSTGILQYVIHITATGGNSNLTTTQNLIVLKDDRLAVAVYCKSSFRVIDGIGDSIDFNRGGCFLFIYNTEGVFEDNIALPLNYTRWMCQTQNGNLYVLGSKKYYSYTKTQSLCKVNVGLKNADLVIPEINTTIEDMITIENTLWLLESEALETKHYAQSKRFTLSSLNIFANKPIIVSTIEFGITKANEGHLVISNNEPKIVFSVKSTLTTGIEVNGFTYACDNDHSRWFFVNERGKVDHSFLVKGIQQNNAVLGLDDGGYLIRYIIYDSLIFEGEKPILAPKHRDFIYELCFVKLTSSYHIDEVIYSGGVGKAFYSPFTVKKDNLYIASPLFGENTIDSVPIELSWLHGFYVRKFGLGLQN